jgi:hypothetical protein
LGILTVPKFSTEGLIVKISGTSVGVAVGVAVAVAVAVGVRVGVGVAVGVGVGVGVGVDVGVDEGVGVGVAVGVAVGLAMLSLVTNPLKAGLACPLPKPVCAWSGLGRIGKSAE